MAERQSKGERAALARHAPDFRKAAIRCICDHVIGDTFETQSFPSRDLLQAYHMRLQNPGLMKHAMKLMAYMLKDLDESAADFALATSVADIQTIAATGKIAVVLSTQGLTPLVGPDIVEDSFYPIETYRRMFAEIGFWSTTYPEGFGSHRELPNVTAELLRRGYGEGDIRKVLGENMLRVYREVWGQ